MKPRRVPALRPSLIDPRRRPFETWRQVMLHFLRRFGDGGYWPPHRPPYGRGANIMHQRPRRREPKIWEAWNEPTEDAA